MSDTPIGDAAREATASPYIGRHRKDASTRNDRIRSPRTLCMCGYRASDSDDLESHILRASSLDDNSTHAEA